MKKLSFVLIVLFILTIISTASAHGTHASYDEELNNTGVFGTGAIDASTFVAEDKNYYKFISETCSTTTYKMSEPTIIEADLSDKGKEFKYLEVKTSKSIFRIYPCGKIEKHTWKEIHANEDDDFRTGEVEDSFIWNPLFYPKSNAIYLSE